MQNKKFTAKCYIDYYGYYRFIDSNFYLHRWVAEKAYGRKIRSYECVHHLDGNKTNNNLYNLIIIRKKEHKEIHQNHLTYYGNWNGPKFIFPLKSLTIA